MERCPDTDVSVSDMKPQQTRSRGSLKIFFGYASGVGKTYSMLRAAHEAKSRGIDVVAGFVDTHGRAQTTQLLHGLESLRTRKMDFESGLKREFDLDAALRRSPRLILVDELAHTNVPGCRHTNRYQDVEELLRAGIDVYSTVKVENIESLNDMVAAITGEAAKDRILDSVFDEAAQVELVDVEPEELIERLQAGEIYQDEKEKEEAAELFTLDKLTALREIALRRCADRINKMTELVQAKSRRGYFTDEHILVCLSSAPSNAKIIRTAARMAKAFHGEFTALFVETSDFSVMEEEDKERIRVHMRLAQQMGAKIETVFGEDVAFQISEFARLFGVSKIVVGRAGAKRNRLFGKPTLTEKLISYASGIDIYIIPDKYAAVYRARRAKRESEAFSLADMSKGAAALVAATLAGMVIEKLGFSEANIITVYILSVLATSVIVSKRMYSLIFSAINVVVFNFFFVTPKYSLTAYDSGYPITFLVMFLAAFITSSLAVRLKNHVKQSAQTAFRTQILFDTNQLLQQEKEKEGIVNITANQLIKLLSRDIVYYPVEKEQLREPKVFLALNGKTDEKCVTQKEREVAAWVLKNNKHAGATTDTLSEAKCLYLAVRVNHVVYGIIGILLGEKPLDAFENSIVLSILGECALALENERTAREREEAAVLAKNEQLRADLLRAISHDLRTPLTSISGNASNLLFNSEDFDKETKKGLYKDIYEDSLWLINLVENLLSVSRIEEGRMNLRLSAELMDEVISEALQHVNRRSIEHVIVVENSDDILLARIDARLIVQVVINIVDNAIKYTPRGSHITISTVQTGQIITVKISDDGPGMDDEVKSHVFDMFYTGSNKVADSRRSLGLGLSLCRSIIHAHGGEITVKDNQPQGTVFSFTLPAGEVQLHE